MASTATKRIFAAARLLVAPHGERERRTVEIGRAGRSAARPASSRARMRSTTVAVARPERLRHPRRRHHADGDRLAVQEPAVLGEHLDGMADGVAEVERGAQPGQLALVARRRRRPSGAPRSRPPSMSSSRSRREHVVELALDGVEQRRVADDAVLDHLRQSRRAARDAAACDSTSTSASTQRGWWNTPIRFLPCAWFTAVLPPMAASTCASERGGHLDDRQAAQQRGAAAKPPRSPTTPPPSATSGVRALDAGFEQPIVDQRRATRGSCAPRRPGTRRRSGRSPRPAATRRRGSR